MNRLLNTIIALFCLALLSGFVSAQDNDSPQLDMQTLKNDFASIDKDDNGFIDPHELRSSVPGIVEDDITSFFDRYDGDRDGVISLEEYLMILNDKKTEDRGQSSSRDA